MVSAPEVLLGVLPWFRIGWSGCAFGPPRGGIGRSTRPGRRWL